MPLWGKILGAIAAVLIVVVGAGAAFVLYQRHWIASELGRLSLAQTLALSHELGAPDGQVQPPDSWPAKLLQRAVAGEAAIAPVRPDTQQTAPHGKPGTAAMPASQREWRQQFWRQMGEQHLMLTQMMTVQQWCKARRLGDRARATRMAAIWFAAHRDCSTAAACMQLAEAKAQAATVAPEASATVGATVLLSERLRRIAAVPLEPSSCAVIRSSEGW